jgi:hypothetical protein
MQKKGITLESCQEHLDGWVAQSESPQDLVGISYMDVDWVQIGSSNMLVLSLMFILKTQW